MKAISVLVAFVLLQAIMCDVENVTVAKLQKALNKTLPTLKKVNQRKIRLGQSNKFGNLYVNLTNLTYHNVEFKFDESKVLHVKFSNLKFRLTGKYLAKKAFKNAFTNFEAQYTKVSWATSFTVKSVKDLLGKKVLSFKKHVDGEFHSELEKFAMKHYTDKDKIFTTAKTDLKTVNSKDFKEYLRRVALATFETLKKELK